MMAVVQLKEEHMANIGGTAPTKNTAEATSKRLPTSEEIQSRAYQIYVERGGADGSAIEDWLQAERELQQSAKGS
jgi:Protein of unknown function (DUF2934)